MEELMHMMKEIMAWVQLARPPFHIVGILPFVLGTWLAWNDRGLFQWEIFLLGSVGVILIMMATYFAGEYWDKSENMISYHDHNSRFAGGSRVIQKGILHPKVALYSSIISLFLGAGVGMILFLVYNVGLWTIPMGFIGMIAGFFYSTRPIRWVATGVGELWIAFCYGWLPVAVGYYLQTGTISLMVHLIAIPIGLSIFNVILLNEYPDYHADKLTGKKNMVARLGKEKATYLYTIIAIGSWITALFTLIFGVPYTMLILYVPIVLISLFVIFKLAQRLWRDLNILERLMGMNLIVNIGTTASFIIAFLG
jgi:1,4-dihydroxy-2-naphthoate octaprenyltransferase